MEEINCFGLSESDRQVERLMGQDVKLRVGDELQGAILPISQMASVRHPYATGSVLFHRANVLETSLGEGGLLIEMLPVRGEDAALCSGPDYAASILKKSGCIEIGKTGPFAIREEGEALSLH